VIGGALLIFPFPLDVNPTSDGVARWLTTPRRWAVSWFAQHVLGLADPSQASNGSGDKTSDYVFLLVVAIVAAIGAGVWSAVDRRTAHPRLAAGALVVLRYVVGYAMLSYGLAKVLKGQFPDLRPRDLEQPTGEMSPMGLVWTFMGYSTPYSMFAGLVEMVGGVLVLWRRTATIGALVIVAVMTNVVMLNFCYDVPVKLYSTQLLLMAIVIALPGARRLVSAAMGRAVAEIPARERMSPRWERARTIARIAMLGLFMWGLYGTYAYESGRNDQGHDLRGVWVVDTFIIEGVEHSLATDPVRWHKVVLNPRGLYIVPMVGDRTSFSLTVDGAHRTLTLRLPSAGPGRGKDNVETTIETWTYTRPTPDQLVLEGAHHGKPFHAALHLEPAQLLMTRGFHWINEEPLNR